MSAETSLSLNLRLRRILCGPPRYIFLAAMPKSGSTFLSRTLVKVTGYERFYMGSAYWNTEQELYLPRLVDAYGRGTVTQQHPRGNRVNRDLMLQLGIRPVILIRDIHDIVVSVRDHLISESVEKLPGVYAGPDFLQLPKKDQLEFIISHCLPWFFGFYVFWFLADQRNCIETLWLSYEEMTANWEGSVKKILNFYGIQRTTEEIRRALEAVRGRPRRETRVNVGVAGRGATLLSERQKAEIERLASFYPSVDFSRIGIPSHTPV